MTPKPIGSLPEATTSTGTDVLAIVVGGVYYRIVLAKLADGLASATTSVRGLMSAASMTLLQSVSDALSKLTNPVSTPIAAAASIAIPAGSYTITLTGTTEITAVTGMVARKTYIFSYPSGAGLIFMGEAMVAGDVLPVVDA